MSKFLPFGEALAVVRSLGLANSREWLAWCKGGTRPPNMPSAPNHIYKDDGWQGWVHWLGTGDQHTKRFLPFGEALAVARSLGLAGSTAWKAWSKEGLRPSNVPSDPPKIYKDSGWQGWGHWLGTKKEHLPFEEALAVARSLNLASSTEWHAWLKEGRRPPNVPPDPPRVYKDHGWQGWGHWLGTGNKVGGAKEFLPFGEALAVARSLGLTSLVEYRAWCKEGLRPSNVPSAPNHIYKDGGWQGWSHWLGAGGRRGKKFLPFEEALAVVRSLGLSGRLEWRVWCNQGLRPPNVPSNPESTYRGGGWQGWGHWLGTGNQATHHTTPFLPFAEALAVAQSLGLASVVEWQRWCKDGLRPPCVPYNPNKSYAGAGWQGWGHWLGTGNQKHQKKNFLPFEEALRVARALRLVSASEWRAWCRSGARPANVPQSPEQAYKNAGWAGYKHWLRHADPDAAPPAKARPQPASKRGAPGMPGKSGGKRQRR